MAPMPPCPSFAKTIHMRSICTLLAALAVTFVSQAQTYAFANGQWLIGGRFVARTVYTQQGRFTFAPPAAVDSTVDLAGLYCIPPFGDAHTHNLDGTYNLQAMVKEYLQNGVFYVQVVGNYGSGATQARPVLAKQNTLEATYANALLTATYGHGFYPYEPLAMGIYNPQQQLRLADSVKRSRRAENDAYCFLDSVADVDAKWPIIMRHRPDHLKICLLDAANYTALRRAEMVESYGLSPEVAAYVVKKAHAAGLRVFAHVETAEDARLCARIGVDALAHLPGYGWNGQAATRRKYCLTKADVALIKRAGMAVVPTMNINNTNTYDSNGNATAHPDRFAATLRYKRTVLRQMHRAGVPLALGADCYGKTVAIEADSLISANIFTPRVLLDLYCRQTPQHIFPQRKLGLIQEGYEASFLALTENPLQQVRAIFSKIRWRVKQGRFLLVN
jgi:imidazolonepropionase-like amidohydrolase